MRYEIKSIGVWAFVKVAFFVNLVFGFLIGLFYALLIPMFLLPLGGMMPTSQFDFGGVSMAVLLIVLPIVFAVCAAVFQTLLGVVLVLVYNVVARLVGGIELNLKNQASDSYVAPPPRPSVPPPPPRPSAPLPGPEKPQDENQ